MIQPEPALSPPLVPEPPRDLRTRDQFLLSCFWFAYNFHWGALLAIARSAACGRRSPDCGFATFSARPMNDRDTATRKLKAVTAAARVLRGEYATANLATGFAPA